MDEEQIPNGERLTAHVRRSDDGKVRVSVFVGAREFTMSVGAAAHFALRIQEAAQAGAGMIREVTTAEVLRATVAEEQGPIESGYGFASGGFVGWAKRGRTYRNGPVRAEPEEAEADAAALAREIAEAEKEKP
jgi:hypothetical protein